MNEVKTGARASGFRELLIESEEFEDPDKTYSYLLLEMAAKKSVSRKVDQR